MKTLPIVLLLILTGCASTSQFQDTSGYGYSPNDPIIVGGLSERSGPASQRAYLDQLRGPNGEAVTYERIESCCAFSTPNGILGSGMLDIYEVRYEGQGRAVRLYLNMYDPAPAQSKAPIGFTIENE